VVEEVIALTSSPVKLALLVFGRRGLPLMAWPRFDYKVEAKVAELLSSCDSWCEGNCTFTVKKWVNSSEDLEEVLKHRDEIEGVVIYIVTTSINYALFYDAVEKLGKPVLVLTEPYFSLVWPELADLMKRGYPITGVSASNSEDRLTGVRVLVTYLKLKRGVRVLVISTPEESTLETLHRSEIYVGDRVYLGEYFKRVRELLDPVFVEYTELLRELDSISDDRAKPLAEAILKNSYWVSGSISKEDVVKSVKLYYAVKRLVEKYGAEAVAFNCFTIMLRDINALPVTPCLAITLLNDEGIPAACEADLNSLVLQVAFTHIAKRPGWISDPIFDFSDSSVTYAHCTAPTKMNGFGERREQYALDTHDESGKPLVVRVKMTEGKKITVAQISPDFTKLYIAVVEIASSPVVDLACRTKIKVRVENAAMHMWNFKPPLHRVVAYGDWSRELSMLARYMGLEVVED
jgi:L-fucose isomerase-like protein